MVPSSKFWFRKRKSERVSHEGTNCRCRRFYLLLFNVLAQSVVAITAVVAAHVVAIPPGCWRSIDRDRRYRPFLTDRSLVHSTETGTGFGFRDSFWMFFSYKKIARLS